ncbi:MAG: EamA family transporter [Lachnospiraceae bacterium]|nr:EamA family transporter [Lachnospiraceae bacterium]
MWVYLVLFYGLAKGARELVKKKAMQKNTVLEVLFFYTLVSFLLVTPEAFSLEYVPPARMLFIAFKSFIIFVAWMCGFSALHKLPVSVYGILDLTRVLFSTLLGVLILKEDMGIYQILGSCCVILGLLLLKSREQVLNIFKKIFKIKAKSCNEEATIEKAPIDKASIEEVSIEKATIEKTSIEKAEEEHNNSLKEASEKAEKENEDGKENKGKEKIAAFFVLLVMISCFLNAVSGITDKILMKNMESGTLQFWYMLFLTFYYALYAIIKREKIDFKGLVKNPWVYVLSILFVLADRALFMGNAYPESKVTIMTLLKQASCVVVIIGGKIFYKEKNIAYKLVCAGIVILGIVLSVAL